jgi:hypothetical protein
MIYRAFLILTIIFSTCICGSEISAQYLNDTIYTDAKAWSRDSNRKIVYSDWKKFPTITLKEQTSQNQKSLPIDRFGGIYSVKAKPSGFFRTEKIDGRWWVIDPIGNGFIVKAVNSIRKGGSLNNKLAFDSLYVSDIDWMSRTISQLKENGFNTAGSWSEVDLIRTINKKRVNSFVYTPQLSLLSNFAKKYPQNEKDENASVLSHVFNPNFEIYLDSICSSLSQFKNDSFLLGYFSDNELPFQDNLIKKFSNSQQNSSESKLFLSNWISENKIDTSNITKEFKDQFAAIVAQRYFFLVTKYIKKYDPNHLYIGSRIHSSVKDNSYFLKVMDEYVDIHSINYYGYWDLSQKHLTLWSNNLSKPFFITEFYTKAEDANMTNMSGAGWLVKTQVNRGNFYQNFCLKLMQMNSCVGWHWFRYQDNDPTDLTADPSNNDSNKGLVSFKYKPYPELLNKMKVLNNSIYLQINNFKK